MSQPKRYTLQGAWVIPNTQDGEYVLYSDYASLAAENERLTRLLLDLSNAVHIHRANANGSKCDAEINRIVAEVDTIFDIQ